VITIKPGDAEYDDARAVFNGMIDRRPQVIMRCASADDVVEVVNYARDAGLPLSVYGGGHSVTGAAVVDGGVVCDMRGMKGIEVDPEARMARAEAGLNWGEFDAATQEHGLAVTGGRVPDTGIAGLALGSGCGWLERKLGFTCDNLIEADVVTADGRFVRANGSENSDLLWALKGGGGNFGVVTQFTYRLHPVGPLLYGGMLVFPPFASRDIARAYREFMRDAPDEVGGALAFLTAPPEEFVPEEARGKPAVGIIVAYTGDPDEGERAFKPLKDLGPAVDLTGPMPYVAIQQLIEPGNPPGRRNYWKADLLDDLPDQVIDEIADAHMRMVSPFTVLLFQPLGGAVARVPADATALGRRDAAWAYHVISQWEDAGDDERNIEWSRAVAKSLEPSASGGVYITYTSDTGDARVRDAFRDHYDRLVAIKDRYDPGNMFHLGQNIRPSIEAAARAR